MSQIIIEDAAWKAIMADPRLANARRKLSFHEIRLIVQHARDSDRSGEAGETVKQGSTEGESAGRKASHNPSPSNPGE